jgi:mannan endo-1,4-beta-mannosidase
MSAFSNCTSLESITLPDSVTSIKSDTFSYCTSLKSITIPDSVTRINARAFYQSSKLKSVTIKSKKLVWVGKNAFSGMKSSAQIKVPSKKLAAYKKLLKGNTQAEIVKNTK